MKLIAIDLDGTLLSSDGTISEVNAAAVRAAQSKGYVVAISSGRSLHDTQEILHIAGLACPIMTGNGAVTFHEEQLLQYLFLPSDVAEEIAALLKDEDFYYEIYTNKGVYARNSGKEQLKKEIATVKNIRPEFLAEEAEREIEIQYNQRGLVLVDHYGDMDLAQLEPYKLFVLCFDREKLLQLRDRLADRTDISLTTSGKAKLEIGHPEISKGNALLSLADHLGIPKEETVAIGDNLNDLSMFRVAGMSIAMENAEEEVKEASTHMTKHHDENGVAYALENFIFTKG